MKQYIRETETVREHVHWQCDDKYSPLGLLRLSHYDVITDALYASL